MDAVRYATTLALLIPFLKNLLDLFFFSHLA